MRSEILLALGRPGLENDLLEHASTPSRSAAHFDCLSILAPEMNSVPASFLP
jgi:hypothetical protein